MNIEGKGHFLTLAQGCAHTKFQNRFLINDCVDLNQTLHESFKVQGNEHLMTLCWSRDLDGHHTLIW